MIARIDLAASPPYLLRKAMKLSEKTLELNVCAQMHRVVHPKYNLLWFGLTQRQEARMGFDACTRLGGRLLIFQFKASNQLLKRGVRKFQLDHDQLVALQRLAGARRRSVFYAFPLVGNTLELSRKPDLLSSTWLLDVSMLPPMSPPTKRDGTPRASGRHYAYVRPGGVLICSDPVEAPLVDLGRFSRDGFPGLDGLGSEVGAADEFGSLWHMHKLLSSGARGLIVSERR